jgi:outer membrane lipoprotein LolB
MKRPTWLAIALLFAIHLIAGCVGNTRAGGQNGLKNPVSEEFTGRISLVIEAPANAADQQAQSFSGNFELRGTAQAGQLNLISPLGSIVLQLRWHSAGAEIIRGNERQAFASDQAMLEQSLGISLSFEQLFAWLRGHNLSSNSISTADSQWQLDFSAHAQGRITARRGQPTPAVLRIILEQP